MIPLSSPSGRDFLNAEDTYLQYKSVRQVTYLRDCHQQEATDWGKGKRRLGKARA
jgi:hypothetical protein